MALAILFATAFPDRLEQASDPTDATDGIQRMQIQERLAGIE